MLARFASWRVLGALFVVVVLVAGTLTLTRSEGNSPVDPGDPAFFAWGDEPYDDGLGHYLVRVDPTVSLDGGDPFYVAADGTIVIDPDALPEWMAGELALTLQEIAALEVSTGREVLTTDLLEHVDGIVSLEDLGYGIYALSTSYTEAEVAGLPGVLRVDVDSRLASASVDEFSPYQWPLENLGVTPDGSPATQGADIGAAEAWHRTRGSGVIVAVIDSGVDIAHPDLARNIWTNPGEICGNEEDDDNNGFVDDCHGWNFVDGNSDVDDLNGHGTHVAGIIAAEVNNLIGVAGVAPEATLMPLKIGGETPSLSRAMLAIDYAVANGARIINASWISEDATAAEYLTPYLDAAEAAGVLVVTGAGNDGRDIDEVPVWPAASLQPNVLTVAASTAEDLPAEFSNFGAMSVDVFAPGDRIVSTLPGGSYGVFSGTSMAAPHVAGAAALLWAATPEAGYAEVKAALMDRSDGPNDGLVAFRHLAGSDGRLNVARSVFTRLFQSEVVYWFHDFDSFTDDTAHDVTVQVLLNDPEDVPPVTPLRYRATLVAPVDGQIKGIVGHEITVPGVGTGTTDAYGRAYLGDEFERQKTRALLGDGHMMPFEMSLPRGSYALVMEMLDVSDPGDPQLLGQASAVFFEVGLGDPLVMPTGPLPPPSSVPVPEPPSGDPVGSTTTLLGNSDGDLNATPSTLPPQTTITTQTASTYGPTVTSTSGTTTSTVAGATDASTPTTVGETTPSPTTSSTPYTTTTRPPTTSTTVASAGDAPLADEQPFRMGAINPNRGSVEGGTEVVIVGEGLPSNPLVLFGEDAAQIDRNDAPESYIITTPPGRAGLIDVVIVDLDTGDRVVMQNAFTYTTGSDGTANPVPTSTTTTSTPAGSFEPSSTTTTTTSGDSVTTTTRAPATGGDLDDWLAERLVTPEGLEFGDLAPDSPLRALSLPDLAGAICLASPCRGWDF